MCSKEHSLAIWLAGAQQAMEALERRDAFTLSSRELSAAIVSFRHEADLMEEWRGFMRRCHVMAACFKRGGVAGLPKVQAKNLMDSCVRSAKQCCEVLLLRWRVKAERVHRMCCELLAEEEAAKPLEKKKMVKKDIQQEVEECIICLDAARDYSFQPCGHRVACSDCAKAFMQRSQTCPWCRARMIVV